MFQTIRKNKIICLSGIISAQPLKKRYSREYVTGVSGFLGKGEGLILRLENT